MSRTPTIRLDALDYNRLEGEAKKLGIRPSALATILVRGSLSEMSSPTAAARTALDRLAILSRGKPATDAVQLVHAARQAAGDEGPHTSSSSR